MEENGRRDWKSGKVLERRWSRGPKQDPLEMLRGSPMLLKERKVIRKDILIRLPAECLSHGPFRHYRDPPYKLLFPFLYPNFPFQLDSSQCPTGQCP
jgi:hypothetical protein